MPLDTRNRVIDIVEAYHGSLNSSQVRVAELFKPAIQRNAAANLILHNHPSTDPTPSPDDVAVTKAIAQVGSLLDIPLIDHIVLGGNGRYVSLKERGVAFDGRTAERGQGHRVCEGEVIDVYTRRQVLEDGVLVEVSWIAKDVGSPCPTAITAGLHDDLPSIPRERAFSQSYEDQFCDVLFLARLTARRRIWKTRQPSASTRRSARKSSGASTCAYWTCGCTPAQGTISSRSSPSAIRRILMDQTWKPLNRLELHPEDIQYLPDHRCPRCGASPRMTERGEWIRPYQDWYRISLSAWLDHLGYVCFQCSCQHHPQFRGALRVARLGAAILPVEFVDEAQASQIGLPAVFVNAGRVRQAVMFLTQHADPVRGGSVDRLTFILCSLAAGGISPGAARCMLNEWLTEQIPLTRLSQVLRMKFRFHG